MLERTAKAQPHTSQTALTSTNFSISSPDSSSNFSPSQEHVGTSSCMLGIYVRLANSFGAKNLIALKILFCPREGRSMLSPPALGSSRRQGSANDPSGGRRSSQEGLWGRLSSQEAIGGLSRQSLFGGLSALASSRHLGSPEGNGGRSRRTSIENVGMSPGGKAPPLGAAAKRASFFTPDLPRYACIFIPYTPVPTLYRNSPCM